VAGLVETRVRQLPQLGQLPIAEAESGRRSQRTWPDGPGDGLSAVPDRVGEADEAPQEGFGAREVGARHLEQQADLEADLSRALARLRLALGHRQDDRRLAADAAGPVEESTSEPGSSSSQATDRSPAYRFTWPGVEGLFRLPACLPPPPAAFGNDSSSGRRL